MATTNMLLTKPSVSVTAGPTWATNLNTDIDLIDAHDHSSDKGAKVTQSGINITADLEFNANDATEVRTVRFDASTVSIDGSTDVRVLYHVDGDLYYRNESGDAVQLTDGSAINISSAGGITDIIGTDGSFHYNSTSKTFTARYNDSGLLPALVACKDLTIYKSGAFTYSCKLQHTASATTTLTLPNTTATLAHIGAAAQTFAGDITITGDLTVNGTNFIVNSTTMQVDDKLIELAHSPSGSEGNDSAIDGGGIILKSSDSDKSIVWTNSTDSWDFNQSIKTTGDVTVGDDVILDSDSCVIQLGDAQNVNITHLGSKQFQTDSKMYERSNASFAQRAFTASLIMGM
tara:strand:+ start:6975 stop:8012 length:1038 start_codon:yes stop_codon:yes gene_type:complete